jgi:hypothetical protein
MRAAPPGAKKRASWAAFKCGQSPLLAGMGFKVHFEMQHIMNSVIPVNETDVISDHDNESCKGEDRIGHPGLEGPTVGRKHQSLSNISPTLCATATLIAVKSVMVMPGPVAATCIGSEGSYDPNDHSHENYSPHYSVWGDVELHLTKEFLIDFPFGHKPIQLRRPFRAPA